MLGSWYRNEAAKYGRLAGQTTDAERRARFQQEQKLWLQIADELDARDSQIRTLEILK
jgi:hypothetical protein